MKAVAVILGLLAGLLLSPFPVPVSAQTGHPTQVATLASLRSGNPQHVVNALETIKHDDHARTPYQNLYHVAGSELPSLLPFHSAAPRADVPGSVHRGKVTGTGLDAILNRHSIRSHGACAPASSYINFRTGTDRRTAPVSCITGRAAACAGPPGPPAAAELAFHCILDPAGRPESWMCGEDSNPVRDSVPRLSSSQPARKQAPAACVTDTAPGARLPFHEEKTEARQKEV